MDQYSAVDGVPGDWHLVHLGSARRRRRGPGVRRDDLPVARGRASRRADTGLWNEAQRDAFRRIVDFCHANSKAKLCMQLGHSGRKGSTQLGWERMDHPLESGNWPVVSASPIPYYEGVSQVPREIDRVRTWTRSSRNSKNPRARGRSRLRHARNPHGARLPARELHLAADQPAQGRIRRLASRTGCAFRWRSGSACRQSLAGAKSPCRCASRPPTGRRAGCRART